MCPYCDMAKDFLEENNIDFEAVDVGKDKEKAKEMVEKSGQMGVPVITVTKDDGSEEVIVGFDKDRLKELLKL